MPRSKWLRRKNILWRNLSLNGPKIAQILKSDFRRPQDWKTLL